MNVYVYSVKSSKISSKNLRYIIRNLKEIFKDLVIIRYDLIDTIDLSKVKTLIFSGGDGVFNNIINRYIDSDITFGYIPTGTANDIANNLALKNIDESLKVIRNNHINEYPLMRVNNHYFMYALSVGAMSNVSLKTKRKSKIIFKKTIYKIMGIRYLLFSKKTRVKVSLNDNVIEKKLLVLLVLHTKYLGGSKVNKNINDDLLVVFVRNVFDLIRMFIFHNTTGITTKKLLVESDGIWCCDGEKYSKNNENKNEAKEITINDKKIKMYGY